MGQVLAAQWRLLSRVTATAIRQDRRVEEMNGMGQTRASGEVVGRLPASGKCAGSCSEQDTAITGEEPPVGRGLMVDV
jgi:hypothetical protein